MMTLLTADNLQKSYGEKLLFKDISFSINDGDKIGIIGINGTGKSTLLKIISGKEPADFGNIIKKSDLSIEYLSQEPDFDPEKTVIEQIFHSDSKLMNVVKAYESVINELQLDETSEPLQNRLLRLTEEMTALDAWEIESKAKTILTKLGILNFNDKMGILSGGQKKRVALAAALITPCDLLILDEPTNHMDNATIDWLEAHLEARKGALIMITHDRYFLDRVVNRTIELDKGSLYSYQGNYSYFVEKRLERQAMDNIIERKRQNLYRRELAWMRAGVQARATKAKARIQRFEVLEKAKTSYDTESMDIPLGQSRLGKKVIEIDHLNKAFGSKTVLKDFSYTLLRNDRIGIIGDNGVGKSTLLKLLASKIPADAGQIDVGTTVKIGFFEQGIDDLEEDLRAIDYIKKHAEFVETNEGYKITASQMMERFLFNSDLQWSYIYTLSGGEKRRLYLLSILIQAPNVLLLDEPTNDLDIDTLKVLEAYIDEFDGAVVSVSHDRYYLDRTCDRIFSYEGNGTVLEHTGNYSDFLDFKAEQLALAAVSAKTNAVSKNEPDDKKNERTKQVKLKFTYKEEQEYKTILDDISELEAKLESLEGEMSANAHDFVKLGELLSLKESTEEQLLNKMERYEYLAELEEKIKQN